MKDLEVMKLESKNNELVGKMIYVSGLVRKIRNELDGDLTDSKIKELKDYASDISDLLIRK